MQLQADAKQVFGENHTKDSMSHTIQHQPHLKGVGRKEIIFVDFWCVRLFESKSEVRRYWLIEHHKTKNCLSTVRLLSPVDECLKINVQSGRLRNYII